MPATKISLLSGDGQTQAVSSLLALALSVLVTDGNGSPVSGINVTYAITGIPTGATGQMLGSIMVPTDVNGIAQVNFTLGNLPGQYSVSATAAGLSGSPVNFTLTAQYANAIVSVAQLRTYLKKASNDYAQDGFLNDAIAMATSMIERYTGGPIVVQSYTEIYDGSGRNTMRLNNWPIVSLQNNSASDLQYRQSPIDAWMTWETDINYIFITTSNKSSLLLYRSSFYKGMQNYKISYKAGYTTVPAEISRVCLEAAAEIFKLANVSGEGRLGRTSIGRNEGGISVSDSYKDLSSTHKMILASYRRIRV